MTSQTFLKGAVPKRRVPFYQTVEGFRIPGGFSEEAFRSALAYKPQQNNLFIVSYPNCGSVWVENIAGLIYRNGIPFDSALEFFIRTPFLEMMGGKAAENMQTSGAIKMHLPYHLTPMSEEAKYIFVARNPKDCCVSFYHHTKSNAKYKFTEGSFANYFELFIEGEVDFGDYFDTLLSWYEHRQDPNVLFITYEELAKDLEKNVWRIAEFMGPSYKEAMEKDPRITEDVMYYSNFSILGRRCVSEIWNSFPIWNLKSPEISQTKRCKYFRKMREFQEKPMLVRQKDPIMDWRKSFYPDELEKWKKKVKENAAGAFANRKNCKNSIPESEAWLMEGITVDPGECNNYFSRAQDARLKRKFLVKTAGTDIHELWKDTIKFSEFLFL